MPPGTGDVQITLSQCLPFTGAVVVTTPHRLSLVDAAKGVSMFQHMQIPTLALVRSTYFFFSLLLSATKKLPRALSLSRSRSLWLLTSDNTVNV